MVKKLKFTISPDGEVQLDVQGAVGAECDTLTEPFENKLGTVARKDRKDTYYASTENEFQQATSGGSLD